VLNEEERTQSNQGFGPKLLLIAITPKNCNIKWLTPFLPPRIPHSWPFSMSAKKVFISYSHDSDKHRERVLALSERLRADGIETRLDQYVNGTPAEGWPRWMLNQLDDAEFVLVVCTETYYRRLRGHEVPGKGKGADWEGMLITQEIYDSRSTTVRFVPLLFATQDERFIPEPLRAATHYTLTSESAYQNLYDFLLGQAGVEPQPVGVLRTRPRRQATALTFSEPPPFEAAAQLISPREFVDDRVRQAAISLNQARDAKSLTVQMLIETLDRLFDRDTFRREPSVGMCATQEWDYRLHGGVQMLRLLEEYGPFVEVEAHDLWEPYRKLTTAVSRYCQRMAAYLFEPAVGLSELRVLVGTVEFINKIRHKRKWFEGGVDPETCRRIDPHLKKAIRQMERLSQPRDIDTDAQHRSVGRSQPISDRDRVRS
jgi:SEFIR domain